MRWLTTATWDDVPHLSPELRQRYFDSIPVYQRDARTKGIPQLGAGVIYPFHDDDILIEPFKIPNHWPRGYGLDIGWHRVAAVWGAFDPEAEPRVIYTYDEHYLPESSPAIHGEAIRSRGGLWLPGRIDPAARGRSQLDGKRYLTQYRKAIYGHEDIALGVQMLGIANNAVESGILELYTLQEQGLLKVFMNRCPNLISERRLYRRDEHGRIIKKMDHAMDAWRYLIFSGTSWWKPKPSLPKLVDPAERMTRGSGGGGLDWMSNV